MKLMHTNMSRGRAIAAVIGLLIVAAFEIVGGALMLWLVVSDIQSGRFAGWDIIPAVLCGGIFGFVCIAVGFACGRIAFNIEM